MASQEITVDDLREYCDISDTVLNKECSKEHILDISRFLDAWKIVASRLGLEEPEITAIDRDGSSEEVKREKVLKKWKTKYIFKATYRKLVEALLAISRADLAQSVCELLSTKDDASTKDEQTTPQSDEKASAKPKETKTEKSTIPLAERVRCMSSLVSQGPPSIYELQQYYTMKDTTNKIARCHISLGSPSSFVQHSQSTPEKVLMLVGPSGVGKSIFINAIANYILGVTWEHSFRFKLIEDDVSHTCWITAYTFHAMEGSPIDYTLTVIDTPGFGSTVGYERDEQTVNQVKQFLSIQGPNGIDHIDAVGLMAQAALERFTPTQRYVFDQTLSMFGKDLSSKVHLMMTLSETSTPPVLDTLKQGNIPFSSYYKFNNDALYDSSVSNKELFEMSQQSFDSLFSKLNAGGLVTATNLQLTRDVLNEQSQLETLLLKLQVGIYGSDSQLKNGIQSSYKRLSETAMKMSPLNSDHYIEQLIGAEKQAALPGFRQRVKYLVKRKELAELLQKYVH